ncbi:Acetyl-CoA decarbonylase/synthase complex subunit delta [Dirofilaria immitis]
MAEMCEFSGRELMLLVQFEYKRYLEVNFSHSYSIVEDMTLLISKYDIFWMLHLAQIRDGFGYCNTFSA